MNPADYDITTLSGVAPFAWQQPLHFVGTGMNGVYSLGWMSTAPNRRDFGSGISGSHFAGQPDTCFSELRLAAPYPRDTYQVDLTGSLRLLDLRSVVSPAFSGDYYSQDRGASCQIIEYNRGYLDSNGYDGILRFSQPELNNGKFFEVVALTPAAIGKLGVQSVKTLGDVTIPLTLQLPDGTRVNPPLSC
jgi:hypothetical protein